MTLSYQIMSVALFDILRLLQGCYRRLLKEQVCVKYLVTITCKSLAFYAEDKFMN